jgi:hypothetical protein
MIYYPKSQVKTNLYTNGGEFFLKNTETPYTGYYYQVSTGRRFTGASPNKGGGVELIPNLTLGGNPPITVGEVSNPIRTTKNLSDFDSSLLYYNNDVTLTYPKLSNFQGRSLPTPSSPQPTIVDRNNGEYQRYFAKKTNELIYIEISIETYLNFSNGDPKFATDLYEVISLPWSLGGDSESTNRNIVALIEKNNKWYGFSKYFKDNFTS